MDDNRNSSNKRINDLNEKLSNLLKNSKDGLSELSTLLMSESKTLRNLMGQPLSVYFDAYRSEDYTEGGEAYLTFTGLNSFFNLILKLRMPFLSFCLLYIFFVGLPPLALTNGMMVRSRSYNTLPAPA